MKYSPIKLTGNWTDGYALDKHIIESIFLGYDMWGYPRFDNKHSEVGECVFKAKYRNDFSKIDLLVDVSVDFLVNFWKILDKIDLIIPVPASKKRDIQPVYVLVEDIAKKLRKEYCLDYFEKVNDIEAKDLTLEEKKKFFNETLKKNKKLTRKASILIVDDLYSTGFTLNMVCAELLKEEYIENVYVLTMTKTKGR